MTFSIAGVCNETGMVGCAITSSSICVASRCAFVRARTGIVLTQNVTNPDLGSIGLDLMAKGDTPDAVLRQLTKLDSDIQWRQVGILNLSGDSQVFSGMNSLGIHASKQSDSCLALGNLLANTDVPAAMVSSFEQCEGHLAHRLLQALDAGLRAGGELGPVHSAGVLVAAEPDWPIVNLRIDWHDHPIQALIDLWQNYQPQMDAYITRATSPSDADSFGVPGDE